jgi:hypothetical protein
MPRITVKSLAPTERRIGLGETYGSYKGLWYNYTFIVDIWDRLPKNCDLIADEVNYAVWKHREYVPDTATYGQFLLLEVKGGSSTDLNVGKQLYQRTINVSGLWLSKSSETWP